MNIGKNAFLYRHKFWVLFSCVIIKALHDTLFYDTFAIFHNVTFGKSDKMILATIWAIVEIGLLIGSLLYVKSFYDNTRTYYAALRVLKPVFVQVFSVLTFDYFLVVICLHLHWAAFALIDCFILKRKSVKPISIHCGNINIYWRPAGKYWEFSKGLMKHHVVFPDFENAKKCVKQMKITEFIFELCLLPTLLISRLELSLPGYILFGAYAIVYLIALVSATSSIVSMFLGISPEFEEYREAIMKLASGTRPAQLELNYDTPPGTSDECVYIKIYIALDRKDPQTALDLVKHIKKMTPYIMLEELFMDVVIGDEEKADEIYNQILQIPGYEKCPQYVRACSAYQYMVKCDSQKAMAILKTKLDGSPPFELKGIDIFEKSVRDEIESCIRTNGELEFNNHGLV